LRVRHITIGRGILLVCSCLMAAALFLTSCSRESAEKAPDIDPISGETVQEPEQPQAEENDHPTVDWYDYRYSFVESWRDRDLDPTSEVVDYGGDYVHLRVRITKVGDAYPDLKAPLQVLLNCKGREYRIFGKDYSRYSYIWRDYTDFPDDVGEDHVYIVTMELMPYSRAINSSFAIEQAELVLNGIDWTDLKNSQTVPLARFPLTALSPGDSPNP